MQDKLQGKQRIGGTALVHGAPPVGFGAKFYADESGLVGTVTFDISKQGPPGHVHGGALITVLDEAMGAFAWFNNRRVVAVNLNINLRAAVPLDVEVQLAARIDRTDGRKVFTSGEILLPDGQVAVQGHAVFLEVIGALTTFDGANPFQYLNED